MERESIKQRGMEEAPEIGKESSHSAHANGMNEYPCMILCQAYSEVRCNKK